MTAIGVENGVDTREIERARNKNRCVASRRIANNQKSCYPGPIHVIRALAALGRLENGLYTPRQSRLLARSPTFDSSPSRALKVALRAAPGALGVQAGQGGHGRPGGSAAGPRNNGEIPYPHRLPPEQLRLSASAAPLTPASNLSPSASRAALRSFPPFPAPPNTPRRS